MASTGFEPATLPLRGACSDPVELRSLCRPEDSNLVPKQQVYSLPADSNPRIRSATTSYQMAAGEPPLGLTAVACSRSRTYSFRSATLPTPLHGFEPRLPGSEPGRLPLPQNGCRTRESNSAALGAFCPYPAVLELWSAPAAQHCLGVYLTVFYSIYHVSRQRPSAGHRRLSTTSSSYLLPVFTPASYSRKN